MGARAEQARLGFHTPDRAQQDLALGGVVEPGVERVGLRRGADGALDRQQRADLEAGRDDLALELVRTVEVGSGEPAWVRARVAVLAVGEVALDDLLEAGSSRKPCAMPSSVEAKRVIAAAASTPPGRSVRRASARARARSLAAVRW